MSQMAEYGQMEIETERTEQHTRPSSESIGSSAKWPHTVRRPALQLQGSDYHVINLLKINPSSKDTGEVKGQYSDSSYSIKGGLLNKRPRSNLRTCPQASFWNVLWAFISQNSSLCAKFQQHTRLAPF